MSLSKQLQNQLAEALAKWCAAENSRKFYGFVSPQAVKSRQESSQAFVSLLRSVRELSLIKKDQDIELLVSGTPITAGSIQAKGVVEVLFSILEQLHVNSITFYTGLTGKDLEELFQGLAMSIDDIKKEKGVQGYLQTKKVTHIRVDQMHFELLKEGEETSKSRRDASVWELDEKAAKAEAEKTGKAAGGIEAAKTQPQASEHTIEKRNFSAFWNDYLNDDLGENAIVGIYAEFIETAKQNPAELIRVLQRIVKKQKNIENFLGVLSNKLRELGFTLDEVNDIKTTLVKPRNIGVSEEELLRLKEIEKDFEKALEERVENSIREIKKLNKKLTNEKERIDSILRQNSQGVIVINKDGKILSMNSLAEKALGITFQQGQQRPLQDIIKGSRSLSITSDWQKETDDFTPKDVKLIVPDEKIQDMIAQSSAVIESEDGKAIGMLSALQNEVVREELARRKSEIMDVLGHDLRAPILAAKQNLSVLTQASDFLHKLDTDQKKMVELAQKNIEKMEKLVTTIMDVRQLETGKIILRKEDVDMGQLVEESVRLLKSWANDKKISLSCDIAGKMPLVKGDSARLYQVLTNLVSNALKFTPQGGQVLVKAGAEPTTVVISVIDSGIGIKVTDIPRLFKKYEQISLQRPKGETGLGLGLAICKAIVDLHGGTISVESEEGKGSTFSFSLPLKQKAESGE